MADLFEQQIVDFVRKMSDAAILALVKDKLGAKAGGPIAAPLVEAVATRRRGRPARAAAAPAPAPAPAKAAAPAKREAPAAKRKPGRPKKTAALSAERQEVLNTVERLVKASNGVSASDVARQANIPQTRAAAALKELKLAKRIFQGGDRRFARYAADLKTAEQASLNARKTAAGPAAPGGTAKKAAPAAKAPRKRGGQAPAQQPAAK